MSALNFPTGRPIDLACLGRVAVDLYAQQYGSRLEDARSFQMYLGGSSGNLAFGVARLGLKSAMISRVGDEQMGHYLRAALEREGCDTSQLQTDPQRLTALVLLALKDRDNFPLLFMRENCADMALRADGISADFIAGCRALAVTGTHLSTPGTREAALTALGYARRHRVVRVLDIDYRPVLWGLTPRGAGANRYLPDASVTQRLQQVLGEFDLLVGTEEEFLIAGGVPHQLMASLQAVRQHSQAVLVVKRGALGCCVIEGALPARIEDAPGYPGERVEVLNVLGAGDAFLAGLLTGLLQGRDWAEATRIANACGAIVVSRHACSASMPTPAELAHWFSGQRNPKVDADRQLAHLHRVTVARQRWDKLCVMAFDHRSQFYELAREAGAAEERIQRLKLLLVRAAEQVERSQQLQGQIGVLIDGGAYGSDALAQATGRGWWVGRPVELPGSRPLRFDGTRSIGSALVHWPTEQVVKCLVHYHPDDPVDLRLAQEQTVLELWQATRASGNELLLELIPPCLQPPADAGPQTHASAEDEVVLRAVKRFYNLGVKPEWWKLAPMRPEGWSRLAALIAERDSHCRGAVILGLNQPLAYLADSFRAATDPVVKGFMVGRTLWAQAALQWLRGQIDDQALTDAVADNFARLVQAWQQRLDSPANTSIPTTTEA
ncbi:bifunctional 5-dehydro-2-deoxygluconokinase/5-dehydro-2-deoxyphosphogluconate aldolase [Verminephrobacter eiseniae]|uniref:bifunctional 5-dehydro-2-deoxygluconokinase/5-dehydro-2- deoxyphosphogluconate aldolase n=1 Tax=Verminephrobacter eiseniae TaxID=364317 RepID=UPI002237766D|nr:5-dehydro-2-deoxygluconokinase [Verminephrobacter eiseniae]MCW5232904.1 5-dehydro-2-deoxygluconokinase [Verminephrobacter eiseniae]MCW5261072.1 5-dehydro-2-deoxygluconokinase [Verminephrobacter eiseniae]MCW5295542.1 5-dehydro-2-deoxygluconokinase [Verminephrobacter eiseniae]MCW8184467.1 5-dehydro-2-deoxygluconokinase [Verminephrobacter eiseniae]MCW8223469.1 5-dehydro-2-deoxygluconokinase [Verminephrobacter eiseniae]